MCGKSTSLWLDVESSMSKYPLSNLLFIRKSASLKSSCTNPITISTVKAWHAIRKLEGRSQFTSVFTPICNNPDFPPGVKDNNFRVWQIKEYLLHANYWMVLPWCLLVIWKRNMAFSNRIFFWFFRVYSIMSFRGITPQTPIFWKAYGRENSMLR